MAIALDLGSYSDISDYSSLVDKVKQWIDRGDLDQLIPTFISNAESYLNRTLRTPEMEAVAPVSAIGGAFQLPLDCLQVRGVQASRRPLRNTSPGVLLGTYAGPEGYVAGCASEFAITGRTVQVAPVGDDALVLSYWQRIPTLGVNQQTNWLLDAHPDVYLFGALFHANTYVVDGESAAAYATLFETAVQGVQDAGQRSQYAGPIVARSPVRAVGGVRA